MVTMTAVDAWAEVIAMGFSPFKVTCSAHRGSQLVRRGGAREAEDGFVHVFWLPHGDSPVPQSGAGVVHADGSGTFELRCPKCGQPRQIRQDRLVRLLRERVAAGDADTKGRVVLDLAELAA
jgi:hypothetical protein